jgi:two-component system, OmpR family, phosphate regulon sensor histidine kinase PhoR
MENQLKETAAVAHERMVSLINSMSDGVVATDEEGKVVLFNGAAMNILDVNTELSGKSVSDVINLIDVKDHHVSTKTLVISTKTSTTNRDLRLLYPDKSTINLYLSIAPVKLGFGSKGQKGYVILMRDITHEKSLEEERNEFISVVSHELRTPIAIAEGNIGNAQFVAGKYQGLEDIKSALKFAHEQVVYLAEMINDLSTLSRAERGKLKTEIEKVNIPELLGEIENNYRPSATKKNLEFTVHANHNILALKSSKLYIREILQNFISNAIKYTDSGSVKVTAKQVGHSVIFDVADTGIGISTGDQELIFNKFFRSEDFRTRQHNGTGLGLYVTRKLADLVHAKISVHSQLDHGSIFTVEIPSL